MYTKSRAARPAFFRRPLKESSGSFVLMPESGRVYTARLRSDPVKRDSPMKRSLFPICRRWLGAATLSLLAATLGAMPAQAATPKDTLVVAAAFDDIITMDPAEAFEISAGEIMGNIYDRLVRFD